MDSDFTKFYNKNGYIILKDIIPRSKIDSLLESIFKLYCKYSNNSDDFQGIQNPWTTELFHTKLIEFRETNPQDFGAIYDTLKTSLSLTKIVTDDNINYHHSERCGLENIFSYFQSFSVILGDFGSF